MHTVKHKKADALYKTFERKGPGADVSHYCPGCGHGTAHNLIAEAIDDLDIKDKVVFCSPVGCSVFGYYYFDAGNIQCAHGRAPAVASAINRVHEDAILISYQGDGDLAGIGMSNIIHAANRGENITVFFVNNAIYGMTGGQMAPTTLLNQKTVTTPNGRSAAHEGYPLGMAEMISSMKAPVYVERVSLASAPKVMKARKAIRKGLQNQVEKKGFSFVEILSPCPINWKMSPVESRNWMKETLEPAFPLANFVDREEMPIECQEAVKLPEDTDARLLEILNVNKAHKVVVRDTPVVEQNIKIAGFGGQGVLSAGILLSNCGIAEGLKTTWLPSYGAEMRGGTANASVNISQEEIGSPIVSFPNVLVALNAPSLDAFEPDVQKGGLILVNSSMVKRKVERDDVDALYIPATDMAKELGTLAIANVIILTVYALKTGVFTVDTLREIIPQAIKRKNLVEVNMKAIDAASKWYEENA